MTVSREEIERIAQLAQLTVEDTAMEQLVGDIDSIVAFVGQLSTIDTDNTLPTYRPGPSQAPLRPDVVSPIELAQPIEDFAPLSRDGFFLVPRVDGGESE